MTNWPKVYLDAKCPSMAPTKRSQRMLLNLCATKTISVRLGLQTQETVELQHLANRLLFLTEILEDTLSLWHKHDEPVDTFGHIKNEEERMKEEARVAEETEKNGLL